MREVASKVLVLKADHKLSCRGEHVEVTVENMVIDTNGITTNPDPNYSDIM